MKTQLLKYFQNRQPNILKNIADLVEIQSPSKNENGNHAVVDFLVEKTKDIACITSIERVYREGYGEHLIIHAFESEEQPILLIGHTDTVHPLGSKINNPTRIEGDKFYGCGIFDMKASCILMLEILRAFSVLNLKPKLPIKILFCCDEEVGSPTGREIVEKEALKAAFCLVTEPSANGHVKTGRKGTGKFVLKAHGIAAHAGLNPDEGASAILEVCKQTQKLHTLNAPEQGTTVNVCLISGGTASNTIPEHASIEIDVRFNSMSEAERIQSEIRCLQSVDKSVSLEVLGKLNRPPLERTEAVVALYEKAKALAETIDYALGEAQVGGGSDGNFVGALGIPVLDGLGVTGDGAHCRDEYILISDIMQRSTLIALLLL